MNVNFEAPKPEIKVFYNKNSINKSIVTQVLLGIEEEGLPYSLEEKDSNDGVELAYKAAEISHLGVGIGIGDRLVLHYIKLKENAPLFCVPLQDNENILRAIGANAARLVKRMPFKDINDAK